MNKHQLKKAGKLIRRGINIKNNWIANHFESPFPIVHIHIGVHKTATTFIQDQLESSLKNNQQVTYIPRDTYREKRQHKKYIDILNEYDRKLPLLLSEENLIGTCSDILDGELYGRSYKRISKIIRQTRTDSLKIFLSVRSMTKFLVSAYSEHLRHNEYIEFCGYMGNLKADKLSWYEVFSDVIGDNKNVEFYLFNFEKFETDKAKLLELMSFNIVDSFSPGIHPSRSAFTNHELYTLSTGKHLINNNEKFDPFTLSDHTKSSNKLNTDLLKLSAYKNVHIINK